MARKTSKEVEDADKHLKFQRIVQPRVNRAIRAIDLIGNCAVASYSYSTKEVDTIQDALLNAVSAMTKRFRDKGKQDSGFKFD